MSERNKLPVSVQLLLEKDNKILLLKRQNTGYEDGKYCLPGGHVESNEEIRQAMKREAKEEIGIDINIKDLTLYKVLNRKIIGAGEYIDFIFKVNSWSGTIENIEKERCEELKFVDKNKLPENILDFIKKILEPNNSIYLPYDWEEE